MVALNGTSLNGTSLHDAPVNGGWVPPVILPRQVGGSRALNTMEQPHPADPPVLREQPHSPLDELDRELARLEAEVVVAKARADNARARLADRDANMRALLRVALIASRDAVAQMEREHETTLAMLRAAAQAEVERVLAKARQRAAGRTAAVVRADGPGANDGE